MPVSSVKGDVAAHDGDSIIVWPRFQKCHRHENRPAFLTGSSSPAPSWPHWDCPGLSGGESARLSPPWPPRPFSAALAAHIPLRIACAFTGAPSTHHLTASRRPRLACLPGAGTPILLWAAVQATSLGFVPSLIGTQPISAVSDKLGVDGNTRGATPTGVWLEPGWVHAPQHSWDKG